MGFLDVIIMTVLSAIGIGAGLGISSLVGYFKNRRAVKEYSKRKKEPAIDFVDYFKDNNFR